MIAVHVDRGMIEHVSAIGKNEIDIAANIAIIEVGSSPLRVQRILITQEIAVLECLLVPLQKQGYPLGSRCLALASDIIALGTYCLSARIYNVGRISAVGESNVLSTDIITFEL